MVLLWSEANGHTVVQPPLNTASLHVSCSYDIVDLNPAQGFCCMPFPLIQSFLLFSAVQQQQIIIPSACNWLNFVVSIKHQRWPAAELAANLSRSLSSEKAFKNNYDISISIRRP